MAGDDAFLEFDSDIEASDRGTTRRGPALVAVLYAFSECSSSTS